MFRPSLIFVAIVALIAGADSAKAQHAPHDAGYLYLSPVPGAPYVSDKTRYILVRFVSVAPKEVTNLTNDFISVSGYFSGSHRGTTHVAGDGRTVIFEMGTDFIAGELVTVSLTPVLDSTTTGNLAAYQYQFIIDAPMPGGPPTALISIPTTAPGRMIAPTTGITGSGPSPKATGARALVRSVIHPNGVSVPSDFPQVVITVNSNPAPGYLFLENALDDVPPYTMMLDNNGLPVWYRRGRMYDFKIQKNGLITWALSDDTGFPAFDQNFNYIKTYLCTNGYLTDSHDLKVMPDGTYFMIGYQFSSVDMSQYVFGGSEALVRETVVQEFTPAGELIFQWRAWDNYNLADLEGNTDFPHMNGIDIDEDGNILVSCRHLSEITKISRDSGDVIWRLSGPHSSFQFVNDPFYGTSFQHNISALGNGHYMVFDNGDSHLPAVSRAVEYQLDLTNLTATVVWQFRDNPDKYAYYLGSAQRLPGGNTLINFVMSQYPKAIEVDTNGVKRFELSLVPSSDSYRAFRLPWSGVVASPYLVVDPQPDNITLVFNKFGDTNVAFYRIYGGPYSNSTNLLAESTVTLKPLYNLQNGTYYFRVTAVSSNGVESPFSNEERVTANITKPGQNMVQNGDFSSGTLSWGLSLSDGSAGLSVQNGAGHITITNGGTSALSIRLLQFNKALIQGYKYVLDFDAWSSQPRYIQAKLTESVSPYINYSGFAPSHLTPNPTHYRYTFIMQQFSDFSAALEFDLGASTADVHLQNISLFNPPAGDLNLDSRVDFLDLGVFVQSWLKQTNGLPSDLDGNGRVDFNDFNIMGGNWGVGIH